MTPMKNFNSKKQAHGFTLIELMLSLAAIVTLTAIVFIAFPKVMASRNATYEAQVLSTAVASTKSLFTSGKYDKLSDDVAAKGAFFPDSMINANKTAVNNQFDGGDVHISGVKDRNATAVTGAALADSRLFGISYAQVPETVCVKLAGAAEPNFPKIVINGQEIKNTLPGGAAVAFDESAATTNCNGVAGGVTMAFITN